MTFFEKIKSLCDGRGISPNALVTELGYSGSTATTWKNMDGLPRAKTLKKVADYFGLTVEEIKYGIDTPIDYKKINIDEFNQPVWQHFLQQNNYDEKKAIKAYLSYENAVKIDAMSENAPLQSVSIGNISNSDGAVSNVGGTINAAPLNEQEAALMEIFRKLDAVQKSRLLVFAADLQKS